MITKHGDCMFVQILSASTIRNNYNIMENTKENMHIDIGGFKG